MQNEMLRIVVCKYCGSPEYYGEMRWLSGKCCCRECYKTKYEDENGHKYRWHDLDGHVPTMEEYKEQEKEWQRLYKGCENCRHYSDRKCQKTGEELTMVCEEWKERCSNVGNDE